MSFCTNCGYQRLRGAPFCTNCGIAFSADPEPRARRSALAVFGALGAFGLFGCLLTCTLLILVLEVPDPVGLGLSTIAAIIPAVFYSMLVLYLDRNEKEPWYFLAGAFAWGAVVAIVFSYFFNSLTGAVVESVYGAETGEFVSLAIAAPFFEEIFKGAALLLMLILFRSHFDNVLDGIVYGALVGLGFAMTENIVYFGRAYFDEGIVGIGILFVLRAVIGGLGHALYTATFGAALGWSRSRYGVGISRFIVPTIGLGLAMLQHSLWNATAYFAGTLASDDAALIVFLALIFIEPILFILPATIVIIALAVVTSRREVAMIRTQLSDEIQHGVITRSEFQQVSDGSLRRRASLAALRAGGPALWLAHRRFVRLTAQLAFQKYHASRGESGKRGLRSRSPDELRGLITQARADLYRRGFSLRNVPRRQF
jgi:protease PrsW